MIKDIVEQFTRCNQAHVFKHMSKLSETEQATLLKQATRINLNEVLRIKEAHVLITEDTLSPPDFIQLPKYRGDKNALKKAKKVGEQAIRLGKVAAITVAGGQGTRLGFTGPKGTFPATPIKHKPLFQVFAEKISVAQNRYATTIPWFIMTSEQNHKQTVEFFSKNNNFELDEVHCFQQEQLPTFDHYGKILMESPGKISLNPNGHGGVLSALHNSGAFERMSKLDFEILSYFQVDNPLVHCIDPVFIGYHLINKSEMSSKMIHKVAPNEKIGVFGIIDEKLNLIEYSDIPKDLTTAKDRNNRLVYTAGNPAIHLIDKQFATRVANDELFKLPYHRSEKCVKVLDKYGNSVKPEKPNAIKWEMFIFDALPMARNPLIFETTRGVEFSPIKNEKGIASQQTCFEDQTLLFAHWLEEAGVSVPRDFYGNPTISIEISPLFADTAERFKQAWNALENKPQITDNLYVY